MSTSSTRAKPDPAELQGGWPSSAARALLLGASVALVVGSLTGAVARGLMRLVAVAAGHPGEFTWGGTVAVLIVFALAALPGAVAAAALSGRRRWVLPVAGALLLCVPATGVATEEIGSTSSLSAGQWVGLIASSVSVYACIAVLPLLTVRLVDRRR